MRYNAVDMEIKFRMLSDFASLTRDGKLNILGVFDEINAPRMPFVLPQMFLVVAYEASAAEAGVDRESRIILMDADGGELLTLEQPLKIPDAKRPGARVAINQVLGLSGFKFAKPGDYQFSFLVDGDEKANLRLRVNSPIEGEPDAQS